MIGHGISYGAISVMNAIPCGIGSTIGVDLCTEAEFKVSDITKITLTDRPNMSVDLAAVCVKRTMESIGEEQSGYELTIRTQIPPSVGLKSSSSVCNAVIGAVLDAFGESMDQIEKIRLGVRCAKECHVTITGAFDDACGCELGGLVITDNTSDELIYTSSVPKYDVILCIPDTTIPKNKVPVDRYRALSEQYRALVPEIQRDYLKVLTQNGSYIGEIIGYDTVCIESAMNGGALAAGITGTGPAISIVAEHGKGKEIADVLECRTILTETR